MQCLGYNFTYSYLLPLFLLPHLHKNSPPPPPRRAPYSNLLPTALDQTIRDSNITISRWSLTADELLHRLYYAPINVIPGEGGGGVGGREGDGDFDILSKIFVKNHSPGTWTTNFVKKHKNPHPRRGVVSNVPTQRQCYSFWASTATWPDKKIVRR